MNLVSAVRVAFEDLRSLGFASVSASYAAVGNPFSNPIRILKITNLMDEPLLISFNGVNDKDVIAANSACLYDFGMNKADMAGLLEQPANTRVYVKAESSLPATGNVYVTVIYASQV
jgi:hypothetical protein